MRRRDVLAAAGATGLAATAGCLGFLETERASREPPVPENRPDAPYLPSHTEGMEMAGMIANGRYRCALSYTFPHRFWLVNGESTERVDVEDGDDVHLMASVWDAEAGVALPTTSPEITLTGPDGETSSLAPWQMLSQQMGVHYGDNVGLGPEGEYEATVRVAPGGTRRTEDVETPDGPIQLAFSFTFERDALNELPYEDIPANREGSEGAVDPMEMEAVEAGRVPAADSFPVALRGTGATEGAELAVGSADRRGQFATSDDESYLVASLRTQYNRFPLPAATLVAEVARDGETRYEGTLAATLDPELGFHYGAAVPSLAEDDEVTVGMQAPPQVSRHEGYETAFFGFESVTL
ncbi:DUF7350 domain-containing protein [Halobacterium wangiae]|uniref:DUF7350 domain-containing protein n=1 Tax=Halobacterium wangiae TaxID=2902623 RepID=UPI001E55928A|nr:hypothetical protein [Halobacterium wangiae]